MDEIRDSMTKPLNNQRITNGNLPYSVLRYFESNWFMYIFDRCNLWLVGASRWSVLHDALMHFSQTTHCLCSKLVHSKKIQYIPCIPGKCISSKSPWVTAINHQIKAKDSHERTKLKANTINVHLHCESTKVVKMSCKNRTRLLEIFFDTTLQSLHERKCK